MGIKLTVLLFNKRGPFHWSCQHLAAIATDLETGRTFDINHILRGYKFYKASSYVILTRDHFYSYLYRSDIKTLYYIDGNGKIEVIALADYGKFENDVREVGEGQLYTHQEIKSLIMLSGGDHNPLKTFTVYDDQESNSLYKRSERGCCVGSTTLFSYKDFNHFVSLMRKKFYTEYKFNFFHSNCSDAVNFAINELCPEKTFTEILCGIYKMLLFPLCLGSLGLSCFPAPPGCCNTPQDIYDKARWLANFTPYGVDQVLSLKERDNSLEFKIGR